MTALSPNEIRALDGTALTRLAWELGLAPAEIHSPDGCQGLYYADGILWRPHRYLPEADAVFRSLRARGYCTKTVYYAFPEGPYGSVEVWKYPSGLPLSVDFVKEEGRRSEAHALLLCAVLAVMSEGTGTGAREEHEAC